MTAALSPAIASRLEKAAVDNGFDQELPREGAWLGFASTQAPHRVWLRAFAEGVFIATFSQQNVACDVGYDGPLLHWDPVYDAMAEAKRTGTGYQTPLAPPPANPHVAHPDTRAAAARGDER